MIEGGRAGRKAVEEAGFSEELKAKLLERVEASKFQTEHTASIVEAGLSSSAGRGTRDIATAEPWGGVESTEDTVLRMLDDAHKPLKPGLRGPAKGTPGNMIDLRIKPKPRRTGGEIIADARDKASIYAISKDSQMSDKERDEMRQVLQERFTPGARAMPNSIRGLQALANERIEDAIARGQFKNIPRGKDVKRDTRADNPFIDTTEYIMNKMIQRQDIVPPWIEKQQELVRTANNLRARIRFDWKRHMARTISSRGGTLEQQVQLANLYAAAERLHNPKRKKTEEIAVPTTVSGDPLMVQITEEEVSENSPRVSTAVPSSPSAQNPSEDATTPDPNPSSPPLPAPFRDPAWESTEQSYLNLAITNLNNLTRSYNLMAPDLAKKPYYNLSRELAACYADVAPLIAGEIIERATAPPPKKFLGDGLGSGGVGVQKTGFLDALKAVDTVRVWEDRSAKYGMRELWRDLFGGRGGGGSGSGSGSS